MRDIKDLVNDFVKRPVVSMPPAVSVASVKKDYGLQRVVKMCSNENPFGVSPKAAEAMKAEIENVAFYADPEPENSLAEKIAAGIGFDPGNIMITSGAAFALNFICEAFLEKGDEAVLCSPTYPPYYSMTRKNGGIVVDVPMTWDMKFDFDGILEGITEKTKIVFICNPNNPTGCTVYRKYMLEFVEKVPDDVILVMDEAYVQFTENPEAFTMIPAIKQHRNIIVVQTFSKIFGLAGIRVGYAVSTHEIISYMKRESIARSLNVVGIRGALAAMDDYDFAEKTIVSNAQGRSYLTQELTKIGYRVYPSESNFLYVDFGADPKAVTKKLLPYGIILRGDFPHVRISIGTEEQNKNLIQVLTEIKEFS